MQVSFPCRLDRPACCGSSVVEHSLGKGEVESSILSRSTSKKNWDFVEVFAGFLILTAASLQMHLSAERYRRAPAGWRRTPALASVIGNAIDLLYAGHNLLLNLDVDHHLTTWAAGRCATIFSINSVALILPARTLRTTVGRRRLLIKVFEAAFSRNRATKLSGTGKAATGPIPMGWRRRIATSWCCTLKGLALACGRRRTGGRSTHLDRLLIPPRRARDLDGAAPSGHSEQAVGSRRRHAHRLTRPIFRDQPGRIARRRLAAR